MTAGDADRVAELVTQLGYPATARDIERRFSTLAGREDQALLIADDASEVVGWMQVVAYPYLETDESAEIRGLVVADGHRSRGIGSALVSAARLHWVSHATVPLSCSPLAMARASRKLPSKYERWAVKR